MNTRTRTLHLLCPLSTLALTACPIGLDIGDNPADSATTTTSGGSTVADGPTGGSPGMTTPTTGEPGPSTGTTAGPDSTGPAVDPASTGTTGPAVDPESTGSTGTTGPLELTGTSTGETGEADSSGTTGSTGAASTDATTTGGESTGDVMTTGMFEGCLDITDSDTAGDPTAWSRHLVVKAGELYPQSLAVDPMGSVVLGNQFFGTTDLGGGPLVAPHTDSFVVKYDGQDQFQWNAVIMAAKDSGFGPVALAVGCGGEIFVAGMISGTVDFGGEILEATPGIEPEGDPPLVSVDMVIARYTPSGELVWARRFGDDISQRIHDVVTTASGGIVVAGSVSGSFSIDGQDIDAGDEDQGFLAEFDADGALVWRRTFAALDHVDITRLERSPEGLLAVTGLAGTAVDLGGGPLPVDDDHHTFVAQFEANGAHRWSVLVPQFRETFDLAAGPEGKVYITGADTSQGFYDLVLTAYAPTGAVAWAVEGKTDDFAYGSAITVAANGHVAVAGNFRGALHLNNGLLKDPASSLVVARFTANGTFLEGHHFVAGASAQVLRSGPDGELVLGGRFMGTLDLGAGPMTAIGDDDLFIHRFSP